MNLPSRHFHAMLRRPWRATQARCALHLLLAVTAMAVAGCGGNDDVPIAQLARSQQTYIGQQVHTRGTVRLEQDPNGRSYFVLADRHGVLVGLQPAGLAAVYRDHRVTVSGQFDVQPGFGRVIRVVSIQPIDGSSG